MTHTGAQRRAADVALATMIGCSVKWKEPGVFLDPYPYCTCPAHEHSDAHRPAWLRSYNPDECGPVELLQIIEGMAAKGWTWSIDGPDPNWAVAFRFDGGPDKLTLVEAEGDTPTYAIALAACRAAGIVWETDDA